VGLGRAPRGGYDLFSRPPLLPGERSYSTYHERPGGVWPLSVTWMRRHRHSDPYLCTREQMMRRTVAISKWTYPTGRLRGKVDHRANDDRSNDSTSKHQPPSDVLFDTTKRNRDNITKRNTKRSPHLPLHNQGATNRSRGAFRGVDRGSCRFRADSKTKEEAGDEKLGPGVGESFPYRGKSGNDAGQEDTPTTANQSVDGVREPTR
jgi:hypothetical protein